MMDQEEIRRCLWEKAAKAKPQELEIQMRWFTYAFENNDWKSAQKVSEASKVHKERAQTKLYAFHLIGCHESPEQLP